MEDIQSDIISKILCASASLAWWKSVWHHTLPCNKGSQTAHRSDQSIGHFGIITKIEARNKRNTEAEARHLHQTATWKLNCLTKISNSTVSNADFDVPGGTGESSCKVRQPSRLSGCNFDVSVTWISQIVENLPIINARRLTTTWKLECHSGHRNTS